MPTVAIIASYPSTRDRMAAVLERESLTVAAFGSNPHSLRARPDATVIACPEAESAPVLRNTAAALPGSSLIIVMAGVTRHCVRRSVRAGARGVVREEDVEAALGLAVRSACVGQLSVPFDVAEGLEKPVLSSREKEVLRMVVLGCTNSQIAQRLFLAESTVKSHLTSIFVKLGVASRKEAAALVLDPDTGLGTALLAIATDADREADSTGHANVPHA